VKITRTICDLCGHEGFFLITLDSRPYIDGSGHRDYEKDSIDVCGACGSNALNKILHACYMHNEDKDKVAAINRVVQSFKDQAKQLRLKR
jgi:hypothetical protein